MHVIVTGLLLPMLAIVAAAQETQPAALFEDITARSGLSGCESSRVMSADIDGDGRPDIMLDRKAVYLNGVDGRFASTDSAATLAPPEKMAPNVVQAGDVNNDGNLDLFLGFYIDPTSKSELSPRMNEVWPGDGRGEFKQVPDAGVGTHAETVIPACFVDYDRDGNLDLFIGSAYDPSAEELAAFPDRLFRGHGDGTFEDVTERAGLLGVAEAARADSRRPTYGVCHCDWNNDGWQDLLVMTYGRQWNRLWKNNGDGTFTDVAPQTGFDGDADRSGAYPEEVKKLFREKHNIEREDEQPFRANGNTFDCAVADFDNDGDMDCFLAEITHWWAGPSSDVSMLLVNQGAEREYAFKRMPELITRSHADERWNQGDLHAGWLDVENDGRLDLLIASSDYPDEQIVRLYHQRADGVFEDWTERLGFKWINASQISLADVDRDGATDIIVGTSNMRLTEEQRKEHSLNVGLFRNLAAERAGNSFFNVRLSGQAIGARVTIWIGGQRQTREVYGGLGHAGHRDDTDCRFGVGKAAKIDRVEVRWPDAAGTTQVFEGVAAGRFYALGRGGELTPVK
ncbi:MAG: CRTAC1 family protein [Phycisphaerae bacterium]|nr:CRTAC1 family protein [Phycisphaerae bacterium]